MPQPGDDAPIAFTRAAGKRIADAVRKVEIGDRGGGALTFRTPVPEPVSSKVFRIATFTGAWEVSFDKTLTFKNQTSTPNTARVTNLFWPIPDGPERDCAIAREGTAWYLVVPQLYAADAATAATLTTAALEFKTLPVAALATSGTVVFSVSISTCATAT